MNTSTAVRTKPIPERGESRSIAYPQTARVGGQYVTVMVERNFSLNHNARGKK